MSHQPPEIDRDEVVRLRARVAELERESQARVEVEAALRESEARYRALIDECPDPIVVHRDGVFLFVNEAAARMAGGDVRPEDLVGRHALEFLHDEHKEMAKTAIENVSAGNPPLGIVATRVYDAEGKERFVESLDRVISWQGKPAVQVVVRDMTRHEESLRQGQARIDAMLRASPDSLICLGGDGEILDIRMTQSFVNYFGERRRVGRNISELMPEAEAENVKRIFRRVLETGKMERAEHVANVDGEERRFEGRVTPSGPSEVLLVMRDITEERRASNALRDQELRFRKVFEESPLGMALVGTDLKFFQANARLCEMLGYSEDELAELSFLDVTHPDDVDRDLRVLKQLPNADTKSFTLEKRFVRKDGRSVPIRATGTFITQAGTGRIVYGIGMYEDITEERRSESALRDAQVRLHHSERLASLGTFAAGIAHEINNPIGSILIAAQYALGADDVPDDARKGLEDIAVHARRCGKIVKNVLRFARQETLERSDCDLNQCIDRVGDLAGYVADRHRARVIFRPSAGCLPVRISSTAIEQVLLNLVRNAVEAGRPGDEVIVATSVHGEHALLAVSDRGRGMTVEQKTYLFDPFYTTRRADGGTGLGLSISHGIITDHGGTIRVESQPGSGTTVTVALPLLQDSDIQE